MRGRLSSLLGGDLVQLKAASESALAQADAIQRSLDGLDGEGRLSREQIDPAEDQRAGKEPTDPLFPRGLGQP